MQNGSGKKADSQNRKSPADLAATTYRADEAGAPFRQRQLGTMALHLFGNIWLDLMPGDSALDRHRDMSRLITSTAATNTIDIRAANAHPRSSAEGSAPNG